MYAFRSMAYLFILWLLVAVRVIMGNIDDTMGGAYMQAEVWTIIASAVVIVGTLVVDVVKSSRRFTSIEKEHGQRVKEHDGLSKEHSDLSKEHEALSRGHEKVLNQTIRNGQELTTKHNEILVQTTRTEEKIVSLDNKITSEFEHQKELRMNQTKSMQDIDSHLNALRNMQALMQETQLRYTKMEDTYKEIQHEYETQRRLYQEALDANAELWAINEELEQKVALYENPHRDRPCPEYDR